jgi:glycopeptide antibiotics resistance protein
VLNKPIFLANADGSSNGSNFIPFYHVAAYIEDYVYNQIDLQRLILYITAATTLYIPYGFYLRLLLRNAGHLLLTGLMLLLPILVEICQYYFTTHIIDIEHILFGFIGGMIGSALLALLDRRCLSLRNNEFW